MPRKRERVRRGISRLPRVFAGVVLVLGGGLAASFFTFDAHCATGPPVNANVHRAEATSAEGRRIVEGLKDYKRNVVSTYLAFPEWYIVYSAQEYADFLGTDAPSDFPYFASIAQFWTSYCSVYGITKTRYALSAGDHLMLVVIGTSLSAEYAAKGVYENTLGRLTEWLASFQSAEDAFAHRAALEYAAFIPVSPWYEFSFSARLWRLWTDTSLWGPHLIRKWERKGILSIEYAAKAVYAWLIELGTHVVYGKASPEIQVWGREIPDAVFAQEPRLYRVAKVAPRSYVMSIPRNQAFTEIVPKLARWGVQFVEIAGNDEILVTAIAPRDWTYKLKDGEPLFSMVILTRPDERRIALRAPVTSLQAIIVGLDADRVRIEHVYDY